MQIVATYKQCLEIIDKHCHKRTKREKSAQILGHLVDVLGKVNSEQSKLNIVLLFIL